MGNQKSADTVESQE